MKGKTNLESVIANDVLIVIDRCFRRLIDRLQLWILQIFNVPHVGLGISTQVQIRQKFICSYGTTWTRKPSFTSDVSFTDGKQ